MDAAALHGIMEAKKLDAVNERGGGVAKTKEIKHKGGAPSRASPLNEPESALSCVENSDKKREEGNKWFKEGDMVKAMYFYEEVLLLTQLVVYGDFAKDEKDAQELIARATATRMKALMNLALCSGKLETPDAERVVELCDEVLTREPENTTALYRKGKALIVLEKYPEADQILTKAVHLAPQNKTIRDELVAMRKQVRSDQKHAQETFNGMFDKKPGFAMDGRSEEVPVDLEKYQLIVPADKNTRKDAEQPVAEAAEQHKSGRLEAAIIAYEAGLQQTASRSEWAEHFAIYVKLAHIYMDLDCERKAVMALGMVLQPHWWPAGAEAPTRQVMRHALLLKSVCLLNEYKDDKVKEVTKSLQAWTAQYGASSDPSSLALLEPLLVEWLKADNPGDDKPTTVDVAVAHGLLLLASDRRQEACIAFAKAVAAPADPRACFADAGVPWMMLGAMHFCHQRADQALMAYQWSLKLRPHCTRCMTNRSYALAELERHADAAWSFVDALLIAPLWTAEPIWKCLRAAASKGSLDSLLSVAEQNNFDGVRELYNSTSNLAFGVDTPDTVQATLKLMGLDS